MKWHGLYSLLGGTLCGRWLLAISLAVGLVHGEMQDYIDAWNRIAVTQRALCGTDSRAASAEMLRCIFFSGEIFGAVIADPNVVELCNG